MSYTLKCDAQTTTDNLPCGEWDYSTTTYLTEYTGEFDSVRVEHASYYFGGQALDTIEYVNNPYYNYSQSYQYFPNYTSTMSEVDYAIGNESIENDNLFGASSESVISQIVWTAEELTNSGLQAGEISKLRFDLVASGSDLNHLNISMKHTNLDSLSNFDIGNFQEIYYNNTTFSSGLQTLDLLSPFVWDGSSNIIMEVSFENDLLNPNFSANDNVVSSSQTTSNTVAYTINRDGYLQITSGQQVDVALESTDFGNEATVSFWAQGNAEVLPLNTTLFEGFDTTNTRRINCHFPWGNNSIYWDAGFGSGGASRISKEITVGEITDEWTHWAFTKDAVAGVMNIFKNGQLWHTGTEKFDSISIVSIFRIANRSLWDGKLDEFRVWKKSLSQQNITDWMNIPLDNTHPYYNDLVLYYDFNDVGVILDKSLNGYNGAPTNQDMVRFHNSSDQIHEIVLSSDRANITFVQGEYTTSLDSVLVIDSVLVNPISLAQYVPISGYFNISDLSYQFPAGWSYTTDFNGDPIDSLYYMADQTVYNDTVHFYQEPFELTNRYELGRFITPYGIGLDLGAGFRWVYDVTDFANLLKGNVEITSPNTSELVDLEFAFVHGTPARPVQKVSHVWNQSSSIWTGYSYRDLDDDVYLFNTELNLEPETKFAKLKTTITGHGHNSTTGAYPHCCEWKNNTHYLFANGDQIADWHVWQTTECALNPVFPQGGTWPGAREGWCPGDVVKTREFDLTPYILSGQTLEVDYDITPVPANNLGMGSGRYDMTMHLVEYGDANFVSDVEIYDVISPNNWEYVSRKNTICNGIQFVIRNGGSNDLNSARVTFQISGGSLFVYEWTGSLKFMESEIVSVNVEEPSFWLGDGSNNFTITASNPNQVSDEYQENNIFTTKFDMPDVYQTSVALRYRTNNLPQDNSVTVTDLNGNVVYTNTNLAANTLYFDTLDLSNGCYSLKVLDTGDDGLSYWAYPDQGNGFFQFRPLTGPSFNFDPDFGREINYSFVIGSFTNVKENKNIELIMFPNPTSDLVNFESNVLIEEYKLIDMSGRVLQVVELNDYNSVVDLSPYSNGIYFIDLKSKDNRVRKKLIKQ
tara:strand:- start:1941 stop:5210 length:3270 start_codon:yes stop_codon:yes gene_type:complete